MYFKHITLVFCVTLYLIQCEDTPESETELDEGIKKGLFGVIERTVVSEMGKDGRVEYVQLTVFVLRVAGIIDHFFEIPCLAEFSISIIINGQNIIFVKRVEKNYREKKLRCKDIFNNLVCRLYSGFAFSIDDVEIGALAFVALTKPAINDLVEEIVAENLKQDYNIDHEQLHSVCDKVAEKTKVSENVLSVDVLPKTPSGKNVRTFRKSEVKIYALAYYMASSDLEIATTIRILVKKNQKPNGMGREDLKNIIEKVKQEMDPETPFPDFKKFEETFLKSMTCEKKAAEQIVFKNLFHYNI